MFYLFLENLTEVIERALQLEPEVALDNLVRVLVLILHYTGHIYKILII